MYFYRNKIQKSVLLRKCLNVRASKGLQLYEIHTHLLPSRTALYLISSSCQPRILSWLWFELMECSSVCWRVIYRVL